MLDLQAGVHLDEVEGAVVLDQELHRASAGIADGAREPYGRRFAHFRPQRIGQAGGGRLLDDLLVPALDRAVPVEQVQHRAVRIGQHLHLDMAGPGDIALQQQRPVAEGCGRPRAPRPRAPSAKSSARSTMRMPRPPPPAEALTSTG